jgi:hypothetical protein
MKKIKKIFKKIYNFVFSMEFLLVVLGVGININSSEKEIISFVFGIIWTLVSVFYIFFNMSMNEYRKKVKKILKGRLIK